MNKLPQNENSPLPATDEQTARYWEGLARNALVLPRCEVCGALSHPVVDACHRCESPQLVWEEVSPVVRLFSWAVEVRGVIQGFEPPYVICQVTPEECESGEVRLLGTLLGDPADLRLDQRLELSAMIAPGSDTHIAVFRPA